MNNKLKAWLITMAIALICVWGAFNETVLVIITGILFTALVGFGMWGIAFIIEEVLHDREMKRKYK